MLIPERLDDLLVVRLRFLIVHDVLPTASSAFSIRAGLPQAGSGYRKQTVVRSDRTSSTSRTTLIRSLVAMFVLLKTHHSTLRAKRQNGMLYIQCALCYVYNIICEVM
jgi:hypothetical protein